MGVAVAGGTGRVGAKLVSALEDRGHEAVALSRGRGVDLVTGEGLEDAIAGVDAVVDVTTIPSRRRWRSSSPR
jgi:nucleoside-diphosphate-sugar epimerase